MAPFGRLEATNSNEDDPGCTCECICDLDREVGKPKCGPCLKDEHRNLLY